MVFAPLPAWLFHLRFAVAFHHFTDDPGLVPLCADEFQNIFCFFRRYDGNHADAHVEDLIKFVGRHAALLLDDFENRQHVPGTFFNDHVKRLRQHARDIVHETAAGDMREGSHLIRLAEKIEFFQQLLHQRAVADVLLQQFFADGFFQAGNFVVRFVAELLEENFAAERIAVRMLSA